MLEPYDTGNTSHPCDPHLKVGSGLEEFKSATYKNLATSHDLTSRLVAEKREILGYFRHI